MIELFAIIKEQKAAHLQIRCENLSFFRCDTPTELIEYLKGRFRRWRASRGIEITSCP